MSGPACRRPGRRKCPRYQGSWGSKRMNGSGGWWRHPTVCRSAGGSARRRHGRRLSGARCTSDGRSAPGTGAARDRTNRTGPRRVPHLDRADERPDVLVRVPLVRRKGAALQPLPRSSRAACPSPGQSLRGLEHGVRRSAVRRCCLAVFVDRAVPVSRAQRTNMSCHNSCHAMLRPTGHGSICAGQPWGRWGSNPRPDGL
jgi:hypothetical protein